MKQKVRRLVHAALIAAIYTVLTHLQNLTFPESTSMAIQVRLSEALCVLAFFTPAAIPGLAIGCALFNLTFAAALPLDVPVGTLATLLAVSCMYWTRKVRIRTLPLLGFFFPALFNSLLVGWELTVYIGGAFPVNALYVAVGEAIVLLIFGTGNFLIPTMVLITLCLTIYRKTEGGKAHG